nr:MAG TPA: hypothetical protein [Caudoviricetes sp.]
MICGPCQSTDAGPFLFVLGFPCCTFKAAAFIGKVPHHSPTDRAFSRFSLHDIE